MLINKVIEGVILELRGILEQISAEDYTMSCYNLSGASIGQHVRHSIELFQCLLQGYDTGIVNYEKRKRDIRIETDKDFAIEALENITREMQKIDKPLTVEACFGDDTDVYSVPSNYGRELVYNLEHTIHHMALVRVGLLETKSEIAIPESFGVAPSTLQYRKECAR